MSVNAESLLTAILDNAFGWGELSSVNSDELVKNAFDIGSNFLNLLVIIK